MNIKDYYFLSFSVSGVPSVSTPGRKRKNESRKEATQTGEREEKEEMRPTIFVTARGNFVVTRRSVYSYATVFWDKIEATIATYFAYNNDTFPLFFHWRYICCSFCKWVQYTSLGALVTIAILLLGSYCSNSLKTPVGGLSQKLAALICKLMLTPW